MGYGIALIECQGSFRCRLCDWVSVQRSDVGVGKVYPDSGDARPSAANLRVVIEGGLETLQSLTQSFLAAFVRKIKSMEIKVVCFGIAFIHRANGSRIRELYFKRVNDGVRDLVLKLEHIPHFVLDYV